MNESTTLCPTSDKSGKTNPGLSGPQPLRTLLLFPIYMKDWANIPRQFWFFILFRRSTSLKNGLLPEIHVSPYYRLFLSWNCDRNSLFLDISRPTLTAHSAFLRYNVTPSLIIHKTDLYMSKHPCVISLTLEPLLSNSPCEDISDGPSCSQESLACVMSRICRGSLWVKGGGIYQPGEWPLCPEADSQENHRNYIQLIFFKITFRYPICPVHNV